MVKTVEYQIGQYKGKITVNASEQDDTETIIAKAKQRLKEYKCGLSICYEHYKVID